jgi:hypothetical protein
MAYTRAYETWRDAPSTSTPITAAKMQHIENAIASIMLVLESLQSQLEALGSEGPQQTTTVTAETDDGEVTVNWTAALGATGYTVSGEPLTTGGATVTTVDKTAAELTHTFTGLTNGIAYRFTVTIGPSGAQRSVSATPTAAAAAITLSKDESVPNQVTISWTGAADATGYLVGRDGNDVNGSGPWSTTDPATARSRTFLYLVPSTAYTFSVQPLPNGATYTIVGTPISGTVTTDPPPPGPGTVWLSGAGDDNATNTAGGGFGTWRGEPATYARMWADASLAAMSGMDMMFPYKNANWYGVLDIANGGPRDGQTWATAATGGMDSMWRSQCQKIHANWWPNLQGVHLSMAHEMSGNWYPWSVNASNVAAFKTAWKRWHGIVQEELVSKGRNAKVVMSYNFDTTSDISVQTIDPGVAYYDIVGVDFYNMWWGGTAASGLNDQTTWNNNLNAMDGTSPKGIKSWFDYAASLGKPLSIPEWGLSPQAYVDSPFFITTFRNYIATKAPVNAFNPGAGRLAGDSYFNTWPQCRLWPTTSAPNAAAAYRTAKWGAV